MSDPVPPADPRPLGGRPLYPSRASGSGGPAAGPDDPTTPGGTGYTSPRTGATPEGRESGPGGSAGGGGGGSPNPSLRGAQGEREPAAVPIPPGQTFTLQNVGTVQCAALPESNTGYPNWRNGVLSSVLAAGLRPSRTRQFLHDLDHLSFEELLSPVSEEMELIDIRLYDAIARATKGKVFEPFADDIAASADFGNGRQALRVLDKAFNFVARVQAKKASNSIVRRHCKSMDELGPYIPAFKLRLKELRLAGTPLPPTIALDMLRAATEDIKELDATYAHFRALACDSQTTEALLEQLEMIEAEYRDKKQESRGKAAAAGNAAFAGSCNYCKKPGHKEKDCKKKAAERKKANAANVPPGNGSAAASPAAKSLSKSDKKALAAGQALMAGKGKGKGNASSGYPGGQTQTGAGAVPAGSYPPCDVCKKTNHATASCFYRPGGKLDPKRTATGKAAIQQPSAASSSSDLVNPAFSAFLAKQLRTGGYAVRRGAGVARLRRSSGGALAIGRVVGITLAESDADDEEGDDVPPLVTSSG